MTFTLQRSRMLTLLSVFIHGIALASILVNNLHSPEVSGLLVVLIIVSGLRTVRTGSPQTLRLQSGRWSVDRDEALRLESPVFIGRWFIVLGFVGRPGYLVIGQDSLPRDEFRRLRVLLLARANRMMAA